MPISVIPYRSSSTWPVIACHFSRTGTGSAAEPETISRSLEQAALIACCRSGGAASQAAINFV